ncbi:MAG: acyl-CoA dehydrogenase family protein, partial [Planctomycetes bacterium]|nr:acyl-CoA dehydrogenase family protein [Planctomycetota bacterium]
MADHVFDLYDIESLLTEEERMVRDSARAFTREKILPVIEEHWEHGTFPTDLIGEMARAGFLGCNLEGYGCAGLGNVSYGLIMQELEKGDSGVRSFASVQSSLA